MRRIEISNLLTLPTPHGRGLCTLVVDVSPEVLELRLCRGFGLLNSLINFSLGIAVDFLGGSSEVVQE